MPPLVTHPKPLYNRRMKALLRGAAIGLVAAFATPSFGYYDDVHFALTYYMARRCGYTDIQAYRIASACSATDWDQDTEPVQGGNQAWLLLTPFEGAAQDPRWKFHAMRNEREYSDVLGRSPGGDLAEGGVGKQREALWNHALNVTKNPGVFLHSFQDEAPHKGYGTKWGHWPMLPGCVDEYKKAGLVIGGTSDWISYRQADVLSLTERCWGYLQKFMDKNSPYQLWRPYQEQEYAPLIQKLAQINPFPRPIDTELKRQIYIQFYAKSFGINPRGWQNLVNPDELSNIGGQLGVTLTPKELEQQKNGPNVEVAIDAVNSTLGAAGFKDKLPGGHYKYDLDSDGALENEHMADDWYLTGSLNVTLQGAEPVTATLKMPASTTGKEYILPVLTPVKLTPGQPFKWDNLPLGDLILVLEKKDGKSVRAEVKLDRRVNTYEVRLKGATPPGTGPLWVSEGPKAYGFNALGNMGLNKFMPQFSGGGGGATYADPGGGKSGSASWGGIKNAYREGDLFELNLSVSNMHASGSILDFHNGSFRSFGARDPWDPPRPTASLSFPFKPNQNRKKVSVSIRCVPTDSKNFYSCGVEVAWVFEKAADGTKAPASEGTKEGVDVTRKDPPRGAIIEKDKPPVKEPYEPDKIEEIPKLNAVGALPEFKGAPLELKEWEDSADGGGSAKAVNGVMTLGASGASGGEASAFSKTPLVGDFDISFDYEMVKWNPTGENVLSLEMYLAIDPRLDADDNVTISLVSSGDNHQFMIQSSRMKSGEEPLTSKLAPGPAKSGRLRVRRVGSTWTFHSWANGKWESIGKLNYGVVPETYIGLSLVQQESPGAAEVRVKIQKNSGGSESQGLYGWLAEVVERSVRTRR